MRLRFIFRQQVYHSRGQNDGSIGRLGLWLTDDQLSTHRTDLLVNAQFSGGEVQVIPSEGQQLSPAHSCRQFQQEQLVHSLCPGLDEKALNLFLGENFHLLALQGRKLTAHRRVGVDLLPLGTLNCLRSFAASWRYFPGEYHLW